MNHSLLVFVEKAEFIIVPTFSDSANDMNTNAYKAAIHKVYERTIYESTNALPFYVRECGGGWACLESRHKDWRFYYLAVTTRYQEPEVVLQWSLNPEVNQSGHAISLANDE